MKTRYANGQRSIEPDQAADLPEAEAKDLVTKGFAVFVGEDLAEGDAPKRRPARKAVKAAPDAPPAGPDGEGADDPDETSEDAT